MMQRFRLSRPHVTDAAQPHTFGGAFIKAWRDCGCAQLSVYYLARTKCFVYEKDPLSLNRLTGLCRIYLLFSMLDFEKTSPLVVNEPFVRKALSSSDVQTLPPV